MSSGSTLSSDLGNPEICLQYYKATLGFAFFITRSVVCARRVWEPGRDRIARSGLRITRTIICRIRIGSMPMSLTISVSPPSQCWYAVLGSVGTRFLYVHGWRETYLTSGLLSVCAVSNSTIGNWRAMGIRLCDFFGRRWLETLIAVVADGCEQVSLPCRRRKVPFPRKMELCFRCALAMK